MQKAAFRSVAVSIFLIIFTSRGLPAQKFELAKISLGMSEQDAKTAIGPGYQFLHQPVDGISNLLFVFAASTGQRVAYSFALIDGKVQSFHFIKWFAEGENPTIANLRASVAAKLWQPQEPNGMNWYSNTGGHALTDHHCDSGTGFQDTQLLRNVTSMPRPMVDLLKGLPQPRLTAVSPDCGLYVQMSATGHPSNLALAIATQITVENIAAFSNLARQAQQRSRDQQNAQTRQANQVKSPY